MKIFKPSQKPSRSSPGTVHWTQIMLIILTENYREMSDEELAHAIGVSKAAVKLKMKLLHLLRVKAKKVRVPKPKKVKAVKQVSQRDIDRAVREKRMKAESKQRLDMEKYHVQARKKERARTLKSKQVDYSGQKMVRVDQKTWIYVKPGQDAEKLKKQYHRTLSKEGFSKIEN